MELVEVLGWRPGPPPEYRVVFHNPSWTGRLSPPDPDGVWLMEQLILRACPDDPTAIVKLREYDESPRPQKRQRTAEPTESVEAEPTEPVEPAEQAAQVAEATVAERSAAGQPSSAFVGVCWLKAKRQWLAGIRHNSQRRRARSTTSRGG